MKFIYAFLIILACFIPVLIGAGFGLEALIGYCTSNSTCSSAEVCMNAKCRDPCQNMKCGQNAICLVNNHAAICQCLPQYKGDPTWKCEKKCENDRDCGKHATCHQLEYGVSMCECKKGYRGDPWNECQKYCTTDTDCDDGDMCKNPHCIDACTDMSCGNHANCKPSNHAPRCRCQNCFYGNPYLGCIKKNSAACQKAV